jgi:hypothetical protein
MCRNEGLRQQPSPQCEPRSLADWQSQTIAEVNEGLPASRELELDDMIQINNRTPVDAKKALRVQALVDIFHRHSMFIAGVVQMHPQLISVALNPHYIADANQDDIVTCPEAHPRQVVCGYRCSVLHFCNCLMDFYCRFRFDGFSGIEEQTSRA